MTASPSAFSSALEMNFDLVADAGRGIAAVIGEFFERDAARPSVFRPQSMIAMSFSMATTRPLTTDPSKASSSP